MNVPTTAADAREWLGVGRVAEPPGALPQPATRLDPCGPVRPYEIELSVERLCLDATSQRQLSQAAGADPAAIAKRIAEIVASRGKMHNPDTDSGGVAVGTVSAVGDRFPSPPSPGERIASLASLTLTPLRLDRIERVDPASAQVEVAGTAYLFASVAWERMPGDLPDEVAIELYDVCAAAVQTRDLARTEATVYVLGAGHAGKLALAAARETAGSGPLVAIDLDPAALELVETAGLCDIAVAADLRDPLAALDAARGAGAPPADLTVLVVDAPGCEQAAALLTAPGGTVLLFSMATDFGAAALAADGIGSDVRMVVGSGYAPGAGGYALDLVRRSAALREALGIAFVEAG